MDKKTISRISSTNIALFLITALAAIKFADGLRYPLLSLQNGGVLNKINYSIIQIKFNITEQSSNHIYSVVLYPLIPIVIGIIYNIVFQAKNSIEARKENAEI